MLPSLLDRLRAFHEGEGEDEDAGYGGGLGVGVAGGGGGGGGAQSPDARAATPGPGSPSPEPESPGCFSPAGGGPPMRGIRRQVRTLAPLAADRTRLPPEAGVSTRRRSAWHATHPAMPTTLDRNRAPQPRPQPRQAFVAWHSRWRAAALLRGGMAALDAHDCAHCRCVA